MKAQFQREILCICLAVRHTGKGISISHQEDAVKKLVKPRLDYDIFPLYFSSFSLLICIILSLFLPSSYRILSLIFGPKVCKYDKGYIMLM